jgi:hypothetical protein
MIETKPIMQISCSEKTYFLGKGSYALHYTVAQKKTKLALKN